MNTIGQRMKQAREALGLKLKDVEQKTGIGNGHLSYMETGKRTVTERTIKLFCSVFNIDEQWLTSGEGDMFVPTAPATQGLAASPREAAEQYLLEIFDDLSQVSQQKIIDICLTLLDHTQEKKDSATHDDARTDARIKKSS